MKDRFGLNAVLPLALAASLTVFCGCFLYDPPPEIVHGDNYSTATKVQHRGLPSDGRELTVAEAKDIALTNNPNYKSVKYAMTAAWARFYEAVSAYMPTLTANYGAQQQQWTPQSQGGAGIHSQWTPTYAGNLQAQWNVFDGLQTTMNMLSAREGALQSEALDRDARRILVRAVVLSYNQVLLSKKEIEIAKADELFEEQMVEYTQLKYEAGAAALSDLLNFKILVNAARNNVLTSTYSFDTNRFALAELMGLTTSEIPSDIKFPDIEVSEKEDYSLGVEFYLDMAISQRPDLEAQRRAFGAARYNLYSSWGAFLPTANLQMTYGYSRSDTSSTSYPNGAASPRGSDLLYNYGANAQWLLFDGGYRIAKSRELNATMASQEETLTQTWISVVREVRQSYDKLRTSISLAKILSETLKMTLKQRDLVREEYNAGNTSITRLNEVQKDVVDAQLNYAKALIEIANARAQLDAASGVF